MLYKRTLVPFIKIVKFLTRYLIFGELDGPKKILVMNESNVLHTFNFK